jgi:hypothetical protein
MPPRLSEHVRGNLAYGSPEHLLTLKACNALDRAIDIDVAPLAVKHDPSVADGMASCGGDSSSPAGCPLSAGRDWPDKSRRIYRTLVNLLTKLVECTILKLYLVATASVRSLAQLPPACVELFESFARLIRSGGDRFLCEKDRETAMPQQHCQRRRLARARKQHTPDRFSCCPRGILDRTERPRSASGLSSPVTQVNSLPTHLSTIYMAQSPHI